MIRRVVFAVLASLIAGAALAAGEYQVPVPVQQTLPNGLRVVVFPRPGSGLVQAQLVIPAGVDAEPAGARGVAVLTAQMLKLGTSSRTADVFAHDLGQVGGNFSAAAQREYAAIGTAFLPADFESGMELMSDAVINPIFDDAQFTQVRGQAVRELLQLHGDPSRVADEQLWDLALPSVPAARPPLGDLASLIALTRDPLRAFHRDRYRPDHAVLAIGGDVTPEKAFAVAAEWFGRWSGRSGPAPVTSVLPPARRRVRVVDREGMPVAVVRLGWTAPGRGEADELPRTIGARLLQTRLQKRLGAGLFGRGGIHVSLGVVRGAALLSLGLVVPVDSAAAAVSRASAAMRQAVAEPVTEAELAPLRSQILRSYPLRFETLGGLVSQWLVADLDGDADRTLAGDPGRIAALAPDAVSTALRRGLALDAPAVVVVGPAARLRGPLSRIAPVDVVQLDQPPESAAAPRDTLPAPGPGDEALGRQIALSAVAAHGGLENVRRIHDSINDAQVTLVLQGREVHGEMRQLRKDPYRMVLLTSFDQFESRQVLNGRDAWSLTTEGHLQLADSVGVRAMRLGFTSDVPHLLLTLADSSSRLVSRGPAKLDGKDVRVLDVTSSVGERRRIYVDAKTNLVVGMDQNEDNRPGGLTARRIYRDLRPVEGLLIPYEEERQLGGETVMRLFATKVAVNIGVLDAEFERPASMTTTPKK
jgi:zinc protease